MKTTLGGERIGSGGKQDLELRNYERSTHDLSRIARTTMAAGTIVPIYKCIGLPGDSMEIELDTDVKTHPTVGPLFGSYKVELHAFVTPIRLYQALLHMNLIGVGLEMENIYFPMMKLAGTVPDTYTNIDNAQIEPSCIMKYLGISGIGHASDFEPVKREIDRNFNAIPFLIYHDIVKNYYANKMEEEGCVIDNPLQVNYGISASSVELEDTMFDHTNTLTVNATPTTSTTMTLTSETKCTFTIVGNLNNLSVDKLYISYEPQGEDVRYVKCIDMFNNYVFSENDNQIIFIGVLPEYDGYSIGIGTYFIDTVVGDNSEIKPIIRRYPLRNIDEMRKKILQNTTYDVLHVDDLNIAPYEWIFEKLELSDRYIHKTELPQQGLALKTYMSDLFNNWVLSEYIEGNTGINEISAVDVSDGYFTIDSLILARKVYDMLNRIAVSGGTYDDYLNAVYTHERNRGIESPMYVGGLSKELTFAEVYSQSENAEGNQPLGTLAGRGVMTDKNKGGYINIKIDEPSYIMIMQSITPRIDYYQGNDFDMNLTNMASLHRPALDGIGFQDLVTDKMAWFDTGIDEAGNVIYKSAGKQPAWIDYMTDFNRVYGNFALKNNEQFMVLTRSYEHIFTNTQYAPIRIKDLTTYVDPSKHNGVFAQTDLTAQNFWVQTRIKNIARRKMSASLIPNL